jgi:hypothetical protein
MRCRCSLWPKQFAGIDTEGRGEAEDVFERDVAFGTLDRADVGPVEFRAVRKGFLGETSRNS